MINGNAFWEMISEEMKRKNISNFNQLSNATGIEYNTLFRNFEKKTYPRIEHIVNLSLFFDRSLDWMVFGKDPDGLTSQMLRLVDSARKLTENELLVVLSMVEGVTEKR
jgi:hypothetical protein